MFKGDLMEELLKVSVIIPIHNSEATLARCIDSILFQSYKNVECVLIENGSNDNSKKLCSDYAEKYKNIVYDSVEETGVSNARNIGLSLVTGDIIGFCDADDYLEDDAISLIVKSFVDNSKIGVVFCGFNIGHSDKDNIIKEYRGIREQTISTQKALQLTLVNDAVMGSVWNKYYRKNLLKNIKFDKSLSLCEDMHFNAIALNSVESDYVVKIISKPLYCYIENPCSVTHDEGILFDEKDELKYIVALKAIIRDCTLDKSTLSMAKMKIACFAIDFCTCRKIDENKKRNLIAEIHKNYAYLIKNLFVNNWKWNLKRLYYGWKILQKKKNS